MHIISGTLHHLSDVALLNAFFRTMEVVATYVEERYTSTKIVV